LTVHLRAPECTNTRPDVVPTTTIPTEGSDGIYALSHNLVPITKPALANWYVHT
jgi:hypothetical protein